VIKKHSFPVYPVLEDNKMGNSFNGLYEQFLTHQNPTINSIISVLLVIVTGLIAFWIFNFVLNRFQKRYQEKPFFQRNKQFLLLLKKAGNYSTPS